IAPAGHPGGSRETAQNRARSNSQGRPAGYRSRRMRSRTRLLLRPTVDRGIQLLVPWASGAERPAGEQLALPVGAAMAYLELACRAMLVVVLGAAAAGKLRRRDFEGFLVALRAFGLPAGLAGRPAAVLLGAAPLAGYALAFALITAFTAALRRVVHSGQRVVCRCFGASTTPVGVSHLVRNAMFLAVIGLGIAAALASGASIAPSTRLVVIACGALAGAGAARWDDLAY